MIKVPYEELVLKISEKSGLSREQVEAKIKEKMSQLSNLISREGAAHIVANEFNVKIFSPEGPKKISEIYDGMRNININVKVLRIYGVREFTVSARSGKVANLLVGDETGVVRLVLWNEHAELASTLKEGDILSLTNIMVKENQGRKEIHANANANIKVNPLGVAIEVSNEYKSQGGTVRKRISEISKDDSFVDVVATVVQVFEPRFFEVCPECGKRIKEENGEFKCPVHGKVAPDYSYVMNIFLDDGSDTIRCVLFRDAANQFLNMKEDEIKKYRTEPALFEEVKRSLLGEVFMFHGRVSYNEVFDRVELIANRVVKADPKKELERLEAEGREKTKGEEGVIIAEGEAGTARSGGEEEKAAVKEPAPEEPSIQESAPPADSYEAEKTVGAEAEGGKSDASEDVQEEEIVRDDSNLPPD